MLLILLLLPLLWWREVDSDSPDRWREAFEKFNKGNGGDWRIDLHKIYGNPIDVFGGRYQKKRSIPKHFFEGGRGTAKRPTTFTASPLSYPICDSTGKVCLRVFSRTTDYFSPNGDRYKDEVEFSFTFLVKHTDSLQGQKQGRGDPKRFFLTWAISFYNLNGELVNELSSVDEISPPYNCVDWNLSPVDNGAAFQWVRMNVRASWNGKNFNGEIQEDGIYYYDMYILVEREDELGNGVTMVKNVGEIRTGKASLVIDTIPPTIIIVSPADGTLTEEKKPRFDVEFWDDGSGVLPESFEASLDREDITSYFSFSENKAYFTPIWELGELTHNFEVRLEDRAGNLSVAWSSFTVVSSEDLEKMEKVISFLWELKDVYGFKKELEDLRIEKFEETNYGSFVRFKQIFNGIPVETELIVMTDTEGNPVSVFGEYYVIPETFPTLPGISPREAVQYALSLTPPSSGVSPFYPSQNIVSDEEKCFVRPIYYLTILRTDTFRLAYKILVLSSTRRFWVWIDAFDGTPLLFDNLVHLQLPQCVDWCGCICTSEQNFSSNVTLCPANNTERVGFPDVTGQNLVGTYIRRVEDAHGVTVNEPDRDFCYSPSEDIHRFEMASGYFWATLAGRFFNNSTRFGQSVQTTLDTLGVDYDLSLPVEVGGQCPNAYFCAFDPCGRGSRVSYNIRICRFLASRMPFVVFHEFSHAHHCDIVDCENGVSVLYQNLTEGIADYFADVMVDLYKRQIYAVSLRNIANTLGSRPSDYTFRNAMNRTFLEGDLRDPEDPQNWHQNGGLWYSFLWRLRNRYGDVVDRVADCALRNVGRNYTQVDSFFNAFLNCLVSIDDPLIRREVEIGTYASAYLAGVTLTLTLPLYLAGVTLTTLNIRPIVIVMAEENQIDANNSFIINPSFYAFPNTRESYTLIVSPNPTCFLAPILSDEWGCEQEDVFMLRRQNVPQIQGLTRTSPLRAERIETQINTRSWRFRRFMDENTRSIRFYYTIQTEDNIIFYLRVFPIPFLSLYYDVPYFEVTGIPDNPPTASFDICKRNLLWLLGWVWWDTCGLFFDDEEVFPVKLIFKGSFSDPDGDILSGCEWDFGDGVGITTTGNECSEISHSYQSPGIYTVRFRVLDSSKRWSPYTEKTIYIRKIFYRDADGDGYGDPNTIMSDYSRPFGYVENNTDCDDNNPSIHPGAYEICNETDDDCDGYVDEGFTKPTFYLDSDGDGYGNPSVSILACSAPYGYVSNSLDCDDMDPARYPGAPELCDGKDNNCDGIVPSSEADSDGDGWRICDNDCNDGNPNIHPGATLNCGSFDEPDQIDDDCDGNIERYYYLDQDGDGYGTAFICLARAGDLCILLFPAFTCSNTKPDGFSSHAGDCNDDPNDQNAKYIHPGQCEVCGDNGVDNDCDGLNENYDPDAGSCSEICDNNVDEDCDGKVDEEDCASCAVTPSGANLPNILPIILSALLFLLVRRKIPFFLIITLIFLIPISSLAESKGSSQGKVQHPKEYIFSSPDKMLYISLTKSDFIESNGKVIIDRVEVEGAIKAYRIKANAKYPVPVAIIYNKKEVSGKIFLVLIKNGFEVLESEVYDKGELGVISGHIEKIEGECIVGIFAEKVSSEGESSAKQGGEEEEKEESDESSCKTAKPEEYSCVKYGCESHNDCGPGMVCVCTGSPSKTERCCCAKEIKNKCMPAKVCGYGGDCGPGGYCVCPFLPPCVCSCPECNEPQE